MGVKFCILALGLISQSIYAIETSKTDTIQNLSVQNIRQKEMLRQAQKTFDNTIEDIKHAFNHFTQLADNAKKEAEAIDNQIERLITINQLCMQVSDIPDIQVGCNQVSASNIATTLKNGKAKLTESIARLTAALDDARAKHEKIELVTEIKTNLNEVINDYDEVIMSINEHSKIINEMTQ